MLLVPTPDGYAVNFLENHQLEPDHLVKNNPKQVLQGEDQQLKKAVEVLYHPTNIPRGN